MIGQTNFEEAKEAGKDILELLSKAYQEQSKEHQIVKKNGAEILITIELDEELLERLENSKKNGFEILNIIGKDLQVELSEQITAKDSNILNKAGEELNMGLSEQVKADNIGLEILSIKFLKHLEEQEQSLENSKEYAIEISVKAKAAKEKRNTTTNSNKNNI